MVVIDMPDPLPEATLNPITIAIQQADKDRAIEDKEALADANRLQAEVIGAPPWKMVGSTQLGGDCLSNTLIRGAVLNTDTQKSHTLMLTWGIYDSAGKNLGFISAKSTLIGPGEMWRYSAHFLNVTQGYRARFESAKSLE